MGIYRPRFFQLPSSRLSVIEGVPRHKVCHAVPYFSHGLTVADNGWPLLPERRSPVASLMGPLPSLISAYFADVVRVVALHCCFLL